RCLSDETLAIPLDEIQIDDKLHFIKELVEIIDREVKRLKQSRIPIVKVCWNSRRGPEFTWEHEDQMQKKSCSYTVVHYRVIILLVSRYFTTLTQVEIRKCNMRIDPEKTQKEPTYQVVLDALALTTCYLAFLIAADVLIDKCNMRIDPKKTQKKPTYQVVLDALALTTCYPAFLITADVLVIYMQQFWVTINKHGSSYQFKIDKKRFVVDMEELGHTEKIKNITAVVVDHMHQLWRAFATIINKSLIGKITSLDKIRLSRAQILWGMYYKKNIDFVALLWEDFAFQIDYKDVKKQEKMYYPRFTKDDCILGTIRFVSKDEDTQVYGALIPAVMTTPKIRDSPVYQTYLAFATRVATLKLKRIYKKPTSTMIKTTTTSPEENPPKKKSAHATKDVSSKKPSRKQLTGIQIRDTPDVPVSKKKAPTTTDRCKGIDLLSEAALLDDAQMNKVLKQRKRETHSHTGTNEGTGTIPGVPDMPKDQSKNENKSWGESGDDDDINDDVSDDDGNDDDRDDDGNNDASGDERNGSDEDENPNLNQNDDDKEEEYEDEYVRTPANYESNDDENENVDEEEYDRIAEEMYKDVNIELKDSTTYDQVEDDAHVTLIAAHVTQKTEVPLQTTTTIPPPISPFTPLSQLSTPTPTPTPIPAKTSIPVLPDFSSLFQFNQRVSNLEKGLSELKQADQSAQLLATIKSQIPAMVDAHLGTRLGDSIQKALRSYTAEFKKEAQAEKKRYINLIEKPVKDIINNEVKTQLPQILPKAMSDFSTHVIKSAVIESLEDVFLAKYSSQPQSTYEAVASLTEFESKKILIDKMEKSQSNLTTDKHKELYKALVNSYNVDKDIFLVYGKAISLKRDHEDKD
ncbi:hypothetical protein Tco_0678367, partial [Tanacetum coccineum]